MGNKEDCVLVVDDEIVIRELLSDILMDEGFKVETAPNGHAALERLRDRADIVVLFTDIMMPEMDGIELIREARKISPNIVPIVMTGYATLETARAAVKEGAYDYVVKPFNLSEIKMAVSNALERYNLINENARLLEITDLFNISESIASIRDEEQLLDFVLRAALERVRALRGSVMLVSEDGQTLKVANSVGLPDQSRGIKIDGNKSISGWVAQNVKPLLVTDIAKYPELQKLSRKLNDTSFISVPLERKASPSEKVAFVEAGTPRVIAVLNVNQKRDGSQFTEGDLKALSILANHAAAALENVRLIQDIEESQREIVYTLGEIVETRSKETGQHVKRVAEYSKLLALKYGIETAEAEVLRIASPLHDVGKVGIPDAILNKPGKLTPEEFDVMKTHAQLGYEMLKHSKGIVLQTAAIVAWQHQEKFNGTGYPNGLVGDNIHIYGRITSVADVFDALGTERVYKHAWPLDDILALFRKERGEHFDPQMVDLLFANLDEFMIIRDAYPEYHDDLTPLNTTAK